MTLLSPPERSELHYPNPHAATTLVNWQVVPGAAQYRVIVARTPDLQRPPSGHRLAISRRAAFSIVEGAPWACS